MRIALITVSCILTSYNLCCSAQSVVWSRVGSEDAGFEALFPCKPEVSKKLFQQVSKEAYLYSYECKYAGINFSVSLRERFHDFDPAKVGDEIDEQEQMLRSLIGSKANITASNRLFSGFASREFKADDGKVFVIR